MSSQSAVKNSFSTYICYAPEGLFWLNLYICIERNFDSRPLMHNKNIFEKFLLKLVAHIFTLLLEPFAFKLVNYSRHSEFLKFRKNSKSTSFSFQNSDFTGFKNFSKTHCASKIDRFRSKRCQKKRKNVKIR